MAAPSHSTPKNTMTTPTQVTPSPRPTPGAMKRPFSHKSPSGKTPAGKTPAGKTPASLHGHNMSTSSHPSSTPLAAPSFGDDALNYNSPAAAIMASMERGFTPLPIGQDGLGITTGSEAPSVKEGTMAVTRNVEEEKLRRLQDVQQMLRGKIAGRGICREGVERIAQQTGLTHAWLDDNNLSIAGNNCLDLEIVFDDAQCDLVKDVILKISTSGVEEHKQEASAVLKANLTQSDNESPRLPWKNLEDFSANLNRLAHFDQLSTGINCFQAIEGIYHSFRRIWEEEKRRLQSKHVLTRICEGRVGRPAMHNGRKLGLILDYWEEKRRQRELKSRPTEPDAMDIDQSDPDAKQDKQPSLKWTAKLGCEAGYPPIRVAKDWVGEDVFLPNEKEPNGDTVGQDDQHKVLNLSWLDPAPTLVASSDVKDDPDAMAMDGAGAGVSLPKPPNIRFTFSLEPTVLVPMNAVSAMIAQGLTITGDTQQGVTYRQALDALEDKQSSTGRKQSKGITDDKPNASPKRWNRSFTRYDKSGRPIQNQHSYHLHSTTPLWCFPLQSLSFEHPRQLAEIIPVLRQYALLWIIMRKLVPVPDSSFETESAPVSTADSNPSPKKSKQIQKKSNIAPMRTKLDALLDIASSAKANGSTGGEPETLIDVTLDPTSISRSKAKLDLIFPLPMESHLPKDQPRFGTACVEIGPNGDIVVPSTTGLPHMESDVSLQQAANVLAVSEDIGVFVQWLLSRSQ